MLWEPFKVKAPSRTAVGDSETNSQWRTQICQRPFIYYIQLLAMALWTDLETVGNGAEKFLQLNVVFLCRQRRYERREMLATAQWTLHNVVNCGIDACTDVGTSVNTLAALQIEWGNSVQPLKKPTQMPPSPTSWWISFRRWECVSELPIAVQGGAESLKGSQRIWLRPCERI